MINACLKFFSIAGLGPKLLQRVCEVASCKDLIDFMLLRLEDLQNIEGMKYRLIDNTLEVIAALQRHRKSQPLLMLMFIVYRKNVSRILIEKLVQMCKTMNLQELILKTASGGHD